MFVSENLVQTDLQPQTAGVVASFYFMHRRYEGTFLRHLLGEGSQDQLC